ncbi:MULTISPECIES: cytochrome c [Acidiphilium]|uniref:c-type cytochrome n=1 Tax=Acidiphilium TaxID=522 RepID=UPI000BD42AC3|nr:MULTISPECIES: cytochrome c [Acidiphilium]OZB23474.1 MAG: cytochrome C [Acidiphilium sp. 34-64-41]HQT83757.1 cytochrome c [Acidiphilium rubrum]
MPSSSRSGSRLPVWIAAGVFTVAALAVGAGMALGDIGQAYLPTSEVSPPGAFAAMPKPNTTGMSPQQVAVVQRGEYLTTAADCMPCHEAPGAKPFAGGLSFVTPFGTMYSPNITPDKTNGIGNWTNKQFWNALHYGISPGHSLLVFPKYIYPAMPYTSYSKLSKPDVLAIKAYLDAIPAVDAPHVPNALNFPFNIRAVLLGWRILFFGAHPIHYQKSWSPAVRNGAYIAEALGHCTECHSPRNLLFAIKSGDTLAGAQILGEPWYAPNISSSRQYGVGAWNRADLVSYLHEGGNMVNGSAFGPMKSVVDYSLSQLPVSDINDLAAYLQTATKPRTNPVKPMTIPATELAEGHALYTTNCAACHQADGKGIAQVFPNLAGNQAVTGGPADNTIGIVLGGMIPWHANGPVMPAFGSILSDHQIAAVTNYVRTAWGNHGVPNATAASVFAFRKSAPPHKIALADADYLDLPPIASAAARKLGCPLLTDSLIGPGAGEMQIMAGATPDTLANRTSMLMAAVKKANPGITKDQMSQYLLTAYCPVVATQSGMSLSDKKSALKRFMDQAQAMAAPATAAPAKQGS